MEPTKNYMYMDNNYMVDIWDHLKTALAYSFEALYDILGHLDEAKWKSILSMDKYFESKFSYIRK